jgi:NhaP-type Na+/H+ or K+/H+ antiporter
MNHGIMQTLILAVVVGTGCYAFSLRMRVPAILLYLLAGMMLGPMGLGLLHVEHMGHGLFILVEIGVAIILLEGGLSLSTRSFKKAPSAIGRLLLVTIPLTAAGGALLARQVLHLSWDLAIVFGTLIVVTGPTVIGPLLKTVNLSQRLEVILHWESIWGDVAGVVLSALALKFVTISGALEISNVAQTFAVSILTGALVGLAGGFALNKIIFPWLALLQERQLMGIMALAGGLGIFFGAQAIMPSTGPLAVAIAGFYLSYRRDKFLYTIRHFKDQLSVIVISTLFVLLSGSINLFQVQDQWASILLTALALGLIVRPIAVFLALPFSNPPLRERAFISAISPRGILALAAAFYASLAVSGREHELSLLLITTFAVIFISGAFTTVMGKPLARLLGVLESPAKTGLLLVGVNPVSMQLADYASKQVPVSFLDTDNDRCLMLEEKNMTSLCVDVLDDAVYDDAREEGFDRLVAMTVDDALNQLICQKAGLHFGEDNVYAVHGRPNNGYIEAKPPYDVQYAFAESFCLTEALQALETGRARFEERNLAGPVPDNVIPIFKLPSEGGLLLSRAGEESIGQHLCLVFDQAQ